jgi:deoxyguanosine kinase
MARVALSGAIAVGKTTLAKRMAGRRRDIDLCDEDVREFRFLEPYYEAPSSFAFISRIEFLVRKAEELARSESDPARVTLMDRVLRELPTFAAVMFQMQIMTRDEYDLYLRIHKLLLERLPDFDAYIWVRCDTAECLRRIRERGRPFERGITASYLDALDAEYAKLIEQLRGSHRVLCIDTTDDADHASVALSWLIDQGLLCAEAELPVTSDG